MIGFICLAAFAAIVTGVRILIAATRGHPCQCDRMPPATARAIHITNKRSLADIRPALARSQDRTP